MCRCEPITDYQRVYAVCVAVRRRVANLHKSSICAYVRVLVGGVRPVVPGGCSMVVRQLSSVLSGCPVRPARPASAWGTLANPGLNSLYYGDRQMVHESRPI